MCGGLVAYPHGFELDHTTALVLGGADTDANCQLLCVWYDESGAKAGCHVEKTVADLRRARGEGGGGSNLWHPQGA